ncbi:MAG: GNAT family N-acetyltransferase, partial [Gammaproteobacteria bacterium]
PHTRLAEPADNAGILALLRETAMAAASLHVRYERAPDFFAFAACQGDPYVTIVLEDDDGAIVGVGVQSYRPGWWNGQQTSVGYFSDLRISPRASRTLRVEWRRGYEAFLKAAHDSRGSGGCDRFYTAVLKENVAAVQALTRGKSAMRYEPLCEYRAVHVLASRLFAGPACMARATPPAGLRLEWLDAAQDAELSEFLGRVNAGKTLGYLFPEELAFRRRHWPGFTDARFLVARDAAGQLVATVAPWSPGATKRLVADRLPTGLRVLASLLRALGIKTFIESEEIKVCYLTHLEFDPTLTQDQKGRVMRAMVCELFASGTLAPFHLASFIDDPHRPLRPYLRGFFTHETAGILYQILHADRADRRLVDASRPMAIEIGTL